ncbi:importin-9 isoform X1 [Cucumis melo var. makuwa]|uniref:Importin-9 isoform X1 n=1 Tax=Cucumis melo var. makuwa TaxID=1194695 RepID=A0A5D3CB26_CUCMM|nr:importin-9 isoform X1 [Cucumis melo var. makuwa]
MANVIDQDQQWLINCLSATLDPNHEVRSFAEASLNQASLQPGFGVALSKVAANRELPVGLRQISFVIAVLNTAYCYEEGDELFEHPAVSIDEKAVIRKLLLFTLDDSHRKICTAISMAVASIATYDWPEEWPELLPCLLDLMNNRINMNGVHGGLRCLALLSGELDCEMIPRLVPALFPHLLSIVSSPEMYDKYLQTKALSVVYSCISMLGVMSGVYKEETSALVMPMLKPWMEQFSIILGHPVQSEDPDDWSIRMEVLKCMNQFFQNFPSFAESDVTIILQSVWQTFVSSLEVYVRSSIEGVEDPYEGSYDSDGADKSLDSFVIQVVKNNLGELVYYTIAFLQITEQQIHLWSMDSNQFVADEDDGTFSCRVSGALLLEEIVSNCGLDGINAIIDAAKSRFNESKREKASGSSAWWRIREAILFALASLAEQLIEVEPSGVTRVGLGSFLEEALTEDMSISPHDCPFLYARIFTSVAKFSSMIRSDLINQFLHEAVKALGMDVPPPVKVGACRALSELLPEANKEIIGSEMMFLFSSLGNLLNGASDETLHLVLDTLQAAVKAGGELSASIEPILSPVILKMWASHVSDPFISIDLIEVLEAIKNSPGCIHSLASRILPYLVPILDKPQHQPDGLVPGSLDLLTMLLKNAPIDVVKAAYDACFDGVVRIILQTDDHSELQNATESLAAFVSGGKQEILTWGSGFTMKSLLAAASRLLDPKMESSGSFFVGSFILQLILHLPLQMAQHLPDLVAALVRRMQSVQIAGLRCSLILIFARLVHMSAPNIQQLIDLLVSIPAEGNDNSFVYLMSEWTKLQAEIQGAYQIKVTTTALALLLSTRNPHLAQISVQGQITKPSAGITTRSKGKLAPDKWTVIPLPAKILSLLADALIEIQEQVSVDGQDSEWEDAEEDDISNDENLLHSVDATSVGRHTHEYLQVMAKVYDGEGDEYEDDLLTVSDPLNQINLAKYLVDFFMNLYQNDRQNFDNLFKSLSQSQQNAIQVSLFQACEKAVRVLSVFQLPSLPVSPPLSSNPRGQRSKKKGKKMSSSVVY